MTTIYRVNVVGYSVAFISNSTNAERVQAGDIY